MFSNNAAPNGPGMSIFSQITPSSIDLLCAHFVQIRCSQWTRYANFSSEYTLFHRLAMRSFCPNTLLLVDPVCQFFSYDTLFHRLPMRSFCPNTLLLMDSVCQFFSQITPFSIDLLCARFVQIRCWFL